MKIVSSAVRFVYTKQNFFFYHGSVLLATIIWTPHYKKTPIKKVTVLKFLRLPGEFEIDMLICQADLSYGNMKRALKYKVSQSHAKNGRKILLIK